MKQGTAHTSSHVGSSAASKSQAVNPAGADQLGQALAHKGTPLFAGRGFEPPTLAAFVHKHGSQGKHK